MFFDDLISPFHLSTASNTFDRFFNTGHERCSFRPIYDIFETLNKEFDNVFANMRGLHLFNDERMSRNNRERNGIHNNPRSGREYGVTLNGEAVERTQGNNRPFRHAAHDPVRIEPSRLQWYDSNTRRALFPHPPSTSLPRRSAGWLTAEELNKLPLTTYRTRPQAQQTSSGDDSPNNGGNQAIASPSAGMTVVDVRSKSGSGQSPSSYLVPVSRTNNLVPIKPLVSSPSSGAPECEVCLGEYRDKDRIRHLPCGHAFHVNCIDPWLRQATTCPKCRAGVKTGIRRLETTRGDSLPRTVSLARPGRLVSRWGQPIPSRASTSFQQRRPTVAAPVAAIRQEQRRPLERPVNRSEEARRKAGEAAIQRAAAAGDTTTTTTTNH